MSETTQATPEPNESQLNAAESDIAACPTCKRRLLTKTSALCNWCGAKIDNDEYQARAAQTRLERDTQERAGLESLIQEEAQHGILGRLKRLGKQNKTAPPKDTLS
jgi:hypothetical protein